MPNIVTIHRDNNVWASPWSAHPIKAPDCDDNLVTWPSAMHWFHAQSLIQGYPEVQKAITKSRKIKRPRPPKGNPGELGYAESITWQQDLMKALKVPTRMRRNDWNDVWIKKMMMATAYKFDQYNKLQVLLIETGSAHIIYDSGDTGMGAGLINFQTGRYSGANVIGKILMKVRKQIKLRIDKGVTKPLVVYPVSEEEQRRIEQDEIYTVHLDLIEKKARRMAMEDE